MHSSGQMRPTAACTARASREHLVWCWFLRDTWLTCSAAEVDDATAGTLWRSTQGERLASALPIQCSQDMHACKVLRTVTRRSRGQLRRDVSLLLIGCA